MNLLAALLIVLGTRSPDESAYVAGMYRLPSDSLAEFGSEYGAERGRVFVRELGCANCHVPELLNLPTPRRGPDLNGLRDRVSADYLREWFTTPDELSDKTGSVMPHISFGDDPDAVAEAFTHFLLQDDDAVPPPAQSADESAVARGDVLYHTVGCVACHEKMREPKKLTNDIDDIFDDGPVIESDLYMHVWPVDLPDLHRKTNLAALAAFLLDPLATRPDGRMPGMRLSETEARDIAAYLLRDQTQEPNFDFTADPEKAIEGKRLFSELRCAACHTRQGADPPAPSPSWETIAASEDWECGGPANYQIADHRLGQAIRLARFEPTPPPSIREELAAFNCYACHERDGIGVIEPYRGRYFTTTIAADLGDEGRLPPTLTGVGAKLTEAGLRRILLEGDSVRPYMATRMPDFGTENVAHLIPMFLEEDENPNAPATNVSGLEHHHRSHYGRQLMGTEGLGCVTCHDLNGHRSLGIPAIDLAHAPERLQPSWFKRYLLDPASLRPGTRMPAFFPDGVSTYPDLWKGDADKQIEALWIYLREIDQTRLPEGMEDRGNFKLVPQEQPIIHRTFMKDVGPQTIAVGFPEGIHLAFDAARPRFAFAWSGDFMDAESAQADRFTPFVTPLGEVRRPFADGPPVAMLADADAPWPEEGTLSYRGYTLDSFGTPTFHYETGAGVAIQDAARPVDGGTIRRRILMGPASDAYHLRIARAAKIAMQSESHYDSGDLAITLHEGVASLRRNAEADELLVVIEPSESVSTIEWDIAW